MLLGCNFSLLSNKTMSRDLNRKEAKDILTFKPCTQSARSIFGDHHKISQDFLIKEFDKKKYWVEEPC